MAERTLADEHSIQEYDIAIVGGGPGGTTCALRLADSGLKVVLLEKEQFPRDKICGDALSGKVVSTLKYVQPELVPSLYEFSEKLGSWGIRFFAPNGQALDVPFKRERDTASQNAPGFISKRLDFDHFLWREVEKRQHCTLIQNQSLKQALSTPSGIVLKTADYHIKAQLVIGADGAHSMLAKELQGARKIEKAVRVWPRVDSSNAV